MKRLIDLTKSELLSFMANRYKFVDVREEACECAMCGSVSDAKYYYVCEECENS